VDVGSVRVGVATCDPAGLIATPVATLQRGSRDVVELARLCAERDAIEVVVGLPRTLRGGEGRAAEDALDYARQLADMLRPIAVRLVDERFSTVGAQRDLRASGVGTRRGRSVVDQAAAVIILQSALDEERATGKAPGREVQAATPGDDTKVEE
jgi:putative Holliday junction resolvase